MIFGIAKHILFFNVQGFLASGFTALNNVRSIHVYYTYSTLYLMQEGSSDDPCSEVYHGESAGSELEVQAITEYIQSHAPIVASIDFHSYYQQILFPPGKEDLVSYCSAYYAYYDDFYHTVR